MEISDLSDKELRIMVIEMLTKVRITHAQSEYFNKEKTRTKHITRLKNTKLN